MNNSQASTSGSSAIIRKMVKEKTDKENLESAYNDLVEKVSVAGWQEALNEKIIWIRFIFQIILLILSSFCLYSNYQVIRGWLRSGYTDEITDITNSDSLPFSNVTICAQVYFNKTFVQENITISEKLAKEYKQKTGYSLDELYDQLTNYLSLSIRPPKVTIATQRFFSKVVNENIQLYDISSFATMAYPKCENMFKKCSFNDQEFDCCRQAVQTIDNDGACYILTLNFDSDNAQPSQKPSLHQTIVGPKGGLKIEASLDIKGFPWLDDIMDDGYKIFVDAVPYTDMLSPLGAPNGAETFIKVKASKRKLSHNCAPYGQLSMPGGEFMYYDPQGFSCQYRDFLRVAEKAWNCHFAEALYRPNASIACSPRFQHLLESFFILGTDEFVTDEVGKKNKAPNNSTSSSEEKQTKQINEDIKKAISLQSHCPNHCEYWTYSSSASFVYLENPAGTSEQTNTIMYSKIHVYYVDLGYRQFEEVKEKTVYLAFCDFGNAVGFYWGMSIISFFHVFFYLSRYFYFRLKLRKPKIGVENVQIRTIQVAPVSIPNFGHHLAVPIGKRGRALTVKSSETSF